MASTTEIESYFANGDRAFADAPIEYQKQLAQLMRPAENQGFSSEARQWLANRWLVVPPDRSLKSMPLTRYRQQKFSGGKQQQARWFYRSICLPTAVQEKPTALFDRC
jgi:hypothetical protein